MALALRQVVVLLAFLLLLPACRSKPGEWLGLSPSTGFEDLQTDDVAAAATTSSNPAARIQFLCVPSSIMAGSVWSWSSCSSLRVQILDRYGARVVGPYASGNDSGLQVTLSLISGTGSLLSTGASGTVESTSVAVAAASGIADFGTSALKMTLAGEKVVRATVRTSSGSTLSVSSPRFRILPKDSVASLRFLTQTDSVYFSGIGWQKVPVLEVLDEYLNRITVGTKSSIEATFELAGEPNALQGTTTLAAAAGLIRPRSGGLKVLALGANRTLRVKVVSDGNTISADSSKFSVVHGPATQLVWVQQPVGLSADDRIAGNPALEIRDAVGNRVTSGNDASASIGLSLAARFGTLTGTGVSNGVLVAQAQAGVVDLSSVPLFVRRSGQGRWLEAEVKFTGFDGTSRVVRKVARSSTFNIAPGAPSVSVSSLSIAGASPMKADGRAAYTVNLVVSDAHGNPISNYPASGYVQFIATGFGNQWTQPTSRTDARGKVSAKLRATMAGPRMVTLAPPSELSAIPGVEAEFFSTESPPLALSYPQSPATYTLGTAIVNNKPSWAGGTPKNYSVTPALPAGIVFNTATGQLSGIPTAIQFPAVTHTITGSNSAGLAKVGLTVRVNDPLPVLQYSEAPFTWFLGEGVALDPNAQNTSRLTIAPALPAGLGFDTVTGVISGSPSAVSALRTYTVTAFNRTQQSVSTTFGIEVQDYPPTDLSYSQPSAFYVAGTVITPNRPTSSGGTVESYSVVPVLPAGLVFNTLTGVISGRPMVRQEPAVVHTVTASNSGGSATASITLSVAAPNPVLTITGSPPFQLTSFQSRSSSQWWLDSTGTKLVSNSRPLRFEGNCSPSVGTVQAYLSGGDVAAPANCVDGRFVVRHVVDADDEYTVEFRAADHLGSLIAGQISVVVLVDTVPPPMPVILTNNGQSIDSLSPVVEIEGQVSQDSVDLRAVPAGPVEFDVEQSTFRYPLTLSAGQSIRMGFQAVDEAGNLSEPATIDVSYQAGVRLAGLAVSGIHAGLANVGAGAGGGTLESAGAPVTATVRASAAGRLSMGFAQMTADLEGGLP